MCRSLISVAYDGRLYDCDFNQMLDLNLSSSTNRRRAISIFDIDSLDAFQNSPVATADHCFGCTAGAGSSCGGSLA